MTERAKTIKKTIEIDDSGTGDVVGDAFIGLHVVETGEIIFRAIPVAMYNIKNHKERNSFKSILEAVKDGLKELDFNKEIDLIQICRGSCFDLARKWFDEEGINHEPAIVEGKLQDAVEGRLIDHLRSLGVNSPKLTTEAGVQRYFVLFNWVCKNPAKREKFVKTGFPSWGKKWRKIAFERYQGRNRYKNHNNYNKNKDSNEIRNRDEIVNQIQKRAESILNNNF